MAPSDDQTPLEKELDEALVACGFSVSSRKVGRRDRPGRARVLHAAQAAQPDLAPYLFVAADQWDSSDELKSRKLQVVRQSLLQQENSGVFVVAQAPSEGQTLDEILFKLLGIERAISSYKSRLQSEVAQIVPAKVVIDDEEESGLERLVGSTGQPSLWVLLAPGGWGKTSSCRGLAFELASNVSAATLSNTPLPILVEFTREVEALPFEDLLVRFCREHQLDANRSGGFAYLLKRGRALLIVDGFDELASTFGLERARLALERVLSEACSDSGRAVVSSRTQFYELVGRGTILARQLKGKVEERYAELRVPDSMAVVRARLGRRLRKEEEEELERHFGRLPVELGASPLAAVWTAGELRADGLTALERIRSSIDFYEWYLSRVCRREEGKRLARIITDKGERLLNVDEQLLWLQTVAANMLEYGGYQLSEPSGEDLAEMLSTLLDDALPHLHLEKGQEELLSHALMASDKAAHEATLQFIHPSVRDFLLARSVATTEELPDFSKLARPTLELARFLGEYVDRGQIDRGRFIALSSETSNPQLWQTLIAVGLLESATFDSATAAERRTTFDRLVGLRFDQLDLTDCRLRSIDLRGASFKGTTLRHTHFVDCDLSEADFVGAHLEEVEFIGGSLSGANFTGATVASGFVSHEDHRGPRLAGDELRDILLAATLSESPSARPETRIETEAMEYGKIVSETFRTFIPIGSPPSRSRLRESILRNRQTRFYVQTEVLPILLKEHVGVLSRGRPQGGNECLLLNNLVQTQQWLSSPNPDDEVLRSILAALLRREPTKREQSEFAEAISSNG